VLNDLDQDFNYDIEEALILKNAPENIAKMKEVAGQLTINIMNKPRKDKPLLVMDLDYTLFDMKSSAENFNGDGIILIPLTILITSVTVPYLPYAFERSTVMPGYLIRKCWRFAFY